VSVILLGFLEEKKVATPKFTTPIEPNFIAPQVLGLIPI